MISTSILQEREIWSFTYSSNMYKASLNKFKTGSKCRSFTNKKKKFQSRWLKIVRKKIWVGWLGIYFYGKCFNLETKQVLMETYLGIFWLANICRQGKLSTQKWEDIFHILFSFFLARSMKKHTLNCTSDFLYSLFFLTTLPRKTYF